MFRWFHIWSHVIWSSKTDKLSKSVCLVLRHNYQYFSIILMLQYLCYVLFANCAYANNVKLFTECACAFNIKLFTNCACANYASCLLTAPAPTMSASVISRTSYPLQDRPKDNIHICSPHMQFSYGVTLLQLVGKPYRFQPATADCHECVVVRI